LTSFGPIVSPADPPSTRKHEMPAVEPGSGASAVLAKTMNRSAMAALVMNLLLPVIS
jgi:hypothetical protein